jgi:hypothetical protein
MATILDLFKEQNKDLYGLAGKVYIESKGVINPGRAAALAVTSPNAIADMVGNQVAGLIKGSANRPSDTIFKSDKTFAKPISLISGINPNSIEANTDYYIKTSPAPFSNLDIKSAISSPLSAVANVAKDALRNPGATKNTLKTLKDTLKKDRKDDNKGYGGKYQLADIGSKPMSETKIFSEHAPVYQKINLDPKRKKYKGDFVQTATKQRKIENVFDLVNEQLLKTDESNSGTFEIKNNDLNIPYVMFKFYNNNQKIFLPATVTGLSEEFSPEWNGFKYVGSPFNVYRYGGVERNINFSLALYYLDKDTKNSMISNLDKLRKTVYPDENLVSIQYPNNGGYSPIVFRPNFMYLTINGVYENLFGFVEALSFTIEDNVPWSVTNDEMDKISEKSHPSVINVSISFKVLQNHKIEVTKTKGNDGKEKIDSKLIYSFTSSSMSY